MCGLPAGQARARHTYTLEREGKRRRATAGQLRWFNSGEAGSEIRFARLSGDGPTSGQSNSESDTEREELAEVEANLQDCSHPREK
jgi:hypothetical protein